MKQKPNKTFTILKTFSKKDFKLFEQFLLSPFFNKKEDVTTFFLHIKKFHPQYSHRDLDKKTVFRKFFPHQKFEDKKVRYLFTDLTRLLEKYISVNNFITDNRKFSRRLLDEHTKRNNLDEFNRLFNEVSSEEETKLLRDASFYLNRFLLEYKYLNFAFPRKSRKEQSNIEEALENLDKFYIARKLELSCEVENVRSLLAKDYNTFMLDELVEKINGHVYAQTPVVHVYLLVLNMLRDKENEKHFNELVLSLKKFETCFSKNELRELYQYPLNFCIRMINLGKTEYMKRIFEIYKVIVENEVLLPEGILSQWDFKNIVTVSLRLKDFAWADRFINKYKHHIPEKERENAFTYNIANLYFQKGEFSKALKLLRDVEFSDLVYQLDTRAILLKIYFETDDQDALFYHFSAFRKFIRRMRVLSKYQQANYRNLVTYTQKLVRAQGAKEKIKQLKKEVEANPQVADVSWLREKMEELL